MHTQDLIILAIESSCDETAAAVIRNKKIASHVLATQSVHKRYGGVVPELASRAHQRHIIPVVDQALQHAGIAKSMLSAIAFTQGPGLLGALLVGASFAKSMAFSLGIPLIAVNHMQAHVLANFIDEPQPPFPLLCLTVSGGHTQLVRVADYLAMEALGQTRDDAMGEAFDKIAKLMGLPYPGGPLVDHYAQHGDPHRFQFSTTKMPQLDFSFSGIKTAFLYFLRENQEKDANFVANNREDLCASIQHTLVSMALEKLKKAVAQTGISTIAIAGGVAANSGLRKQLAQLADQAKWQVFIPRLAYCTDNAAMIALTAHYQYLAHDFCDLSATVLPSMLL
ncbi:MAG: tRNA (adenosine(37)-N6)-threonylcarbamoyltransferase complex transferase subunit TsaD [Bacteroidota bacterium]